MNGDPLPVDFQQLRGRAKTWTEPIAGQSPAGVPAKLEPAYQAVAAEVAKLDMPSGGAIDWKKVGETAGELLRSRSKDLVLASYLARAQHVTGGMNGLTTGVTLVAEMIDRFWETLHPERLRGRANALQWFVEKTVLSLPAGDLPPSELANVEALEVAAKQLAQIVRARFADAAPAMGPLLERIERLRLSSAPEPSPPRQEPAAPPQPTVQPVTPAPTAAPPKAAVPAVIPGGDLGAGADASELLRKVGDALVGAAGVLRQADSADPVSYRILRIGLWIHLSAPPAASGGKTQIPALPEPLRERLALMTQNEKWAALLEECESATQQYRFALDLHRLSWQALTGLGGTHERARQALVVELRSLLSRMPQLATLSFGDGSPLADPQTRSWIAEEVLKRDEAGPARRQPAGADDEAAASRMAEAKKLLGASQPAEALALLQEGVLSARGGRERFLARLELARLAAGAGLMAVAKAIYEELEQEAAAHGLDAWEPDVVAECLKGLITCARALAKDPRGALPDLTVPYKRLCRLDPAAAHEVWP